MRKPREFRWKTEISKGQNGSLRRKGSSAGQFPGAPGKVKIHRVELVVNHIVTDQREGVQNNSKTQA